MYYLWLNGSQQGPYAEANVRAMLSSDEIKSDTPIWTEGQADWQPVERILKASPPSSSPPFEGPVAVRRTGVFSFLSGVGVTLAVVGAILLALLVIAGSFIGYLAYVGNGLDKSSKEYTDQAIPAIVTYWSQDELAKRESEAFQKATTADQLAKLFTMFRRLGALKSYDGCKGDSRVNYTSESGKVVSAEYLGRATFEKGQAEIKVTLIQEDGAWKIQGFRVDSSVFVQ